MCARPIFVRTEDHIRGHFLICFIALLLLRILQHKMNYSLSVERIVEALNMCTCSEASVGVICISKQNVFFELKNKNKNILKRTVEDFKKIIEHYSQIICSSLVNKKDFDKYLESIIFNFK